MVDNFQKSYKIAPKNVTSRVSDLRKKKIKPFQRNTSKILNHPGATYTILHNNDLKKLKLKEVNTLSKSKVRSVLDTCKMLMIKGDIDATVHRAKIRSMIKHFGFTLTPTELSEVIISRNRDELNECLTRVRNTDVAEIANEIEAEKNKAKQVCKYELVANIEHDVANSQTNPDDAKYLFPSIIKKEELSSCQSFEQKEINSKLNLNTRTELNQCLNDIDSMKANAESIHIGIIYFKL